MKRLVIFDLDGTLLDTVADLATATNHALEALGFPTHPIPAYYNFVGRGINNLFRGALPEGNKDDDTVARMRAQFVPYYNEHNTDASRPYPGIPELLTSLQQRGIRMAVASNKYQAATEKLIAHFFPEVSFAIVRGQCDGFPMKPDPAIVDLIRGSLSVGREETLYVGDSGIDMLTAHNAQVESVGVVWGFRPVEELTSNHAVHLSIQADDILHYV